MIEKLNPKTIFQDIEKYVGKDPDSGEFLSGSIALVGDRLNEAIDVITRLEGEIAALKETHKYHTHVDTMTMEETSIPTVEREEPHA